MQNFCQVNHMLCLYKLPRKQAEDSVLPIFCVFTEDML